MRQLSEEALIRDVERRMIDQYPYLSRADVLAAVAKAHAKFADSRVRDFVPLLIEKQVRRELAGHVGTAKLAS